MVATATGGLDMLKHLDDRVSVPEAVRHEVLADNPAAPRVAALNQSDRLDVDAAMSPLQPCLANTLYRGEARGRPRSRPATRASIA